MPVLGIAIGIPYKQAAAGAGGSYIALSGNTQNEGTAVNTTIGTLSIVGPATGTPVWSLSVNPGGNFNLSGANLRNTNVFDYEATGSYNITVHVTGMTPVVPDQQFTIVVVNVVPVLSSPVGTPSGANATLTVSTTESTGFIYWIVDPSNTPTSIANIKLGRNAAGISAAAAGSTAVSASGGQTMSPGAVGLPNGTYYAQFYHEEASGGQSNIAVSSSFVINVSSYTQALQFNDARNSQYIAALEDI